MRGVVAVIIGVACMGQWSEAVENQNFFEMWFVESRGSHGTCRGEFATRKVGAWTCHVTTPNGTFSGHLKALYP